VPLPPSVATEAELAGIAADRAAGHAEAASEPKPAIARVEDVDAGGVPARLYAPDAAPGVLLYLHGGGFALGDLVTHDGFARRLADRTAWAVLMPDYRRSPEHAWPAAADDAAAAADWLATTGFDRVGLVGDSPARRSRSVRRCATRSATSRRCRSTRSSIPPARPTTPG
jgi:acetyl esterase